MANSNQTSKRSVLSKPGFATAALAALLFVASCSSWFSEDKKSNLDGECVGKDYVELNELITAPYQNCTTSSECPSGSYCESDSDVHHTTATGAICYWQCYADSDCGFGNHCDCNGQCAELDQDAGPGGDPSCPRNEALLATLETGVHYLSTGAANEWPLQETIEPLSDSTGSGCSFTNLTTSGELGVLGAQAVDLDGRLAWEAIDNADWGGPESYLECNESTTLDLDGLSKAVRVVFRIPSGTSVEQGMTLIGKRDGGDGTGASQGSGWNITFENSGQLNVFLYDGSGIVDDWVGAPINGPWPGYIALNGGNYNDGNWHFVEMVVDTSDAMSPQLRARTDLDAGQASTLDPTWSLSTAAPLRVGAYPGDGTGIPDNIQYTYVAGFSGVDAEALINLTTPDNGWWEAAVATDGRSCLYNENCPYGSKCSDDTKTCVFSCIETNHPVQGCTGGTVCDCFGDCVEPGAVAVRRSDDMPFLEVLPRDIPVSSEIFEPRRFSINLVTESADVAAESGGTKITINAPDGVEVSCDATDQNTGSYSAACVLDYWTFELQGPRNRAASSVWVRSVSGSTSEAANWQLKITSASTANHVAYVSVREFDAAAMVPPIFAEVGAYRGTLARLAVGDTTTFLLPDEVAPLAVPIRAWATPTAISFYDETKVISPSGWLRIDTTQDLVQQLLTLPETGNALVQATGGVAGNIRSLSVHRAFDSATGVLSGGFLMEVIGSTRWGFELVRGDDSTCSLTTDCGSGEICTQSLCMPSETWTAGSWEPTPLLSEEFGRRWASAFSEIVHGAVARIEVDQANGVLTDDFLPQEHLGFFDNGLHENPYGIYGVNSGVARPTSAVLPIQVATDLLVEAPLPQDIGVGLSEYFKQYHSHHQDHHSNEQGVKWSLERNSAEVCSFTCSYLNVYNDGYFGLDASGSPIPQGIRDANVPCHDALPVSGTQLIFANLVETHSTYINDPRRATCQAMYENHKSGISDASFPATYADYVSTQCVESDTRLGLTDLATQNQEEHRIFLCPFRPAVFGGNSDDPRTAAERLLCYRPNSNSDLLLETVGDFGAEVSSVTGDLRCEGGLLPLGVNTSTYLDRLESEDNTAAGDILSDCLSELSMEPPAATGDMTAENAGARLSEIFGNNKCFSPANFYPALAALTKGLAFAPQDWPLGGFGANNHGQDAQRMLTHLLRQWTQLHTFIAREGAQTESMARTLRHRIDLGVVEQDAVDKSPGYEALLDESERGWQLLLSFQNIVANFQDEDALINPDYRPVVLQTTSADHEQNIGLPVFVTEGLAAHMLLVTDYVHSVHASAYGECFDGAPSQETRTGLKRAQRAMHYANAVSETWDSLVAASATPTWQVRWNQAQIEFQSARSRAWSAIRDLASCREPGTISERDVPLFFGDAQTTSARYFAASDYLLSGWAVPAVQSAISALAQARSAFVSNRNSHIQDQMSELDAARRLDDLRSTYGRVLLDLCGMSNVESRDVIERISIGGDSPVNESAAPINLESCHIRSDTAECADPMIATAPVLTHATLGGEPAAPSAYYLTDAQAKFAFCRAQKINENPGILKPEDVTGDLGHQYGSQLLPKLQLVWLLLGATLAVDKDLERTPDGLGIYMSEQAGQLFMPWYSTAFLGLESNIKSLAVSPAQRAFVDSTTQECASDLFFAGKHYDLEAATDEFLSPVCYRGTIGEAISQIITAGTRIKKAQAEMERQEANVRQLELSCKRTRYNAEKDAFANQLFEFAQEKRREAKESSDRKWGYASLAVSGATAWYTGSGDAALNGLSGHVVGGVRELFGGDNLEDKMREEELAHQEAMRDSQISDQFQICMASAGLGRNAFKGAALSITEALDNLNTELLQLRNLRSRAVQATREGRAAVAREDGRLVASYAHHYWLDEKIDGFERDFAYAKRLSFMALRAVEYEFQQSLSIRDDVLGATSPEALQDAMIELRQEQVTRTINSRRPEESQLVLSLRDQILRLASREEVDSGERDWSPTQRFVDRLWDDENAVFNDLGEYLGQGITFNLAPSGALEYRCGERLWDLTATLQGDLLDVDAPNTSLFLIRNNSFGSQWCDGRGDESSMQVASMQPTSSLFEDDERGGSEAFGMTKMTAMLQPWFNVPRSEFYKEQYSEGSSEEFAGRGLYGEYTILFPWKGLLEDGFPLERVEDILIRFDYISVDNLTNL